MYQHIRAATINIRVCGYKCTPWELCLRLHTQLRFQIPCDDADWWNHRVLLVHCSFYFFEVGAALVCLAKTAQRTGPWDWDRRGEPGNNYLSHPPEASCGSSSRDGCQFAARLCLNQKLCFSLSERSCWQSFWLFTATFSPTIISKMTLAICDILLW